MAQDGLRKCGTQPADKSLINRRLKAHPVPMLSIKVMIRPVLQGPGRSRSSLPLDHGHQSALTHSEGSGVRRTLARMALADLVHTKGRGLLLCSAM